MANQVDSVWVRYPAMHSYVSELLAAGFVGRKLEAAVEEKFGVHVAADAMRKHVARWKPEIEPVLIEPAGGFAEPVPAPPKREHPKGWEPHVEENGNEAVAISQPTENANPDEDVLIRGWNLDPAQWRIVGPVQCRRWQALTPIKKGSKTVGYEERWLYYYKANLERIDPVRESEISDIVAEIRKHKATKRPPSGDGAFVVCLSDTQMGKSDGDGTRGIVARLLRTIDEVPSRVKQLRAAGESIGTLYLLGLGDLIENCAEFYAQQQFRTQLNRRDQVKVMRRIVVKMLERWAPLFDRVVVAAVGGNHGEHRKDGKSFTDFADNDDVAIFEQVQEILASNPEAYGHVAFHLPDDQLSMTLDVAGVVVAITHGHQAGRGAGVAAKLVNWWKDQAHGQQPAGDATILFSGHYHHLVVQQQGAKTHIQCPSMEGGSDWWRNVTGDESMPGLLTACVGANYPRGWAHLEIL